MPYEWAINGYQGKISCYVVVWLMSRYSVGHY